MRTANRFSVLLGVVAVFSAYTASADTLRFESGPGRVELIELYTSEGCSSCPPADRWFSGLKGHPGLWSEFAPIVFHVDYWDYIGWQDRFARPEFSERQRLYAREGAASAVYTPGVFRNGDDWRGWHRKPLHPDRADETGVLSVEVDGGAVHVRFAAAEAGSRPAVVHVVLLGMDLSTEVRAGENAGKTLRHDFVALDVRSSVLEDRDGAFDSTLIFDESAFRGAGQAALVAWVSGDGTQAPLQAVGGYLVRK